MNSPDELIAEALRGIEEQAAAPRPMADAAWRAGRRRRLAVLTTSAAGVAVAVAAVAVLLPLAAADSPPPPRQHVFDVAPTVPVRHQPPIQFRQVTALSKRPCPPGSHGLPGSSGSGCFHLSGLGTAITRFRSAQVTDVSSLPSKGHYVLVIQLKPANAGSFYALTRKLVGLPSPRDELALIVGGHVIAHPVVGSPIAGGQLEITGLGSRAHAEHVLQLLEAAQRSG